MNDPLIAIENWRDAWYYSLGCRFAGPYATREAAVLAAREETARFSPAWHRRFSIGSGAQRHEA